MNMPISPKSIILEAMQKTVSENGYLVLLENEEVQNRDIHEQALAHRLAVHLEHSGYFSGYNIDCEYNRDGEDPKRDTEKQLFRPDIVVHVRGPAGPNFIMIETKKFNDDAQELLEAKEKLLSHKNQFGYDHAFLVIFPKNMNSLDNSSITEL